MRILIFLILFLAAENSYLFAGNCSSSCNGCDSQEKIANLSVSTEDEWSDEEFTDAGDEFTEAGDEFVQKEDRISENEKYDSMAILKWPLIALGLTLITGFLVRIRQARKLRLPILLGTLILFGFYLGGCPCPISSVQDVFLAGIGGDVRWEHMVWFLGLLPLTYLLGQTWCGWVCHLGAMQEFIFKSNKIEFLKGRKAQLIMKWLRYFLFAALIVQLFITADNQFCKIDPFKAAFNLGSYYTSALILLGLLLVSSLFIYRPFCRGACPIGLVLGWIRKIPGVSVLGITEECSSCSLCKKNCEYQAISEHGDKKTLKNSDCISCGECISACKKSGLKFSRKSRFNPEKFIF